MGKWCSPICSLKLAIYKFWVILARKHNYLHFDSIWLFIFLDEMAR